jgi:SAM-dependent methyltransferase
VNKKLRFYISPFFLSRYYITRDIRRFVKKYKFQGTILDFGCGEKPYEYLFENPKYSGIDFPEYSANKDFAGEKPDFYFDENYRKTLNLPFPDEHFDNAVSFQVLEHHRDPLIMINELARIVKKEGLILLTCPFIGGLHEEPNDFQRLTKYKIRELFEASNCQIITIREQGSFFSSISMLCNEQLNHFASRNGLDYFIAAVLYLPFLIFQYISLIFDVFLRSDKIFINYIVLAKKI